MSDDIYKPPESDLGAPIKVKRDLRYYFKKFFIAYVFVFTLVFAVVLVGGILMGRNIENSPNLLKGVGRMSLATIPSGLAALLVPSDKKWVYLPISLGVMVLLLIGIGIYFMNTDIL